jgi:hypothetical protein
VYDPGRNIIGIAGAICSGLAANREFDLAINYRTPLAFVAVRGQIDILQDLEEYQQAFVRFQRTGLHCRRGKGNSISGRPVMISGNSIVPS